MLAPVSKTSHSPITDAVPSSAQRTVAPEDGALAQLQDLANQSAATTRLQRLSNSANQTDPTPIQRRSKGTAQLAGSTSLQRDSAPDGHVQSPALIGASNTPVRSSQLDAMGIAATTMSNESYAAWQQTTQCKMGVHGAHSHGGQTTVTQLKAGEGVVQGWFLSNNAKAILLIIEGLLTAVAGGVALGFAVPTGAIPAIVAGIMGIGVGTLKIVRAVLMMLSVPAHLSPAQQAAIRQRRKNWINLIRGVESALAMVGAAMVLTDPARLASGVSLAIFAFAKAVRSVATHMARNDAPGTTSRAAKVAALAHIVEDAALIVAGGLTIDSGRMIESGARIAAGGVMLGVGASKVVRTADQTKDAFFPTGAPAAAAGPAILPGPGGPPAPAPGLGPAGPPPPPAAPVPAAGLPALAPAPAPAPVPAAAPPALAPVPAPGPAALPAPPPAPAVIPHPAPDANPIPGPAPPQPAAEVQSELASHGVKVDVPEADEPLPQVRDEEAEAKQELAPMVPAMTAAAIPEMEDEKSPAQPNRRPEADQVRERRHTI